MESIQADIAGLSELGASCGHHAGQLCAAGEAPPVGGSFQASSAAVAAVHGLVRRTADGRLIAARDDARVGDALAAFSAFAQAEPGLLVEDKVAAVALHYRGAPAAGEACRDLARRLGARLGLIVQEGDMVVELRAPGPDKGGAVEAFMAEAPFAGFTPVFIGDDLTDEHGFEAVRALGGYGVVVGARRPTAALYALADVSAAQTWLRRALEAV